MTRILVLSATTGYQLRSFGEAAARLGMELCFATDRCHRLDDPWQDGAVAIRFHEPAASLQAILNASRERPIGGIIAVGDRPTVLAAEAAAALGLPGNPPAAATASANKQHMRERLAAAGCVAPWFRTLPPGVGVDTLFSDPACTFPCVLKPIGLSGSRGVIRADSRKDAVAAEARIRRLLARPDIRALRTGLEETIIVEEYLAGPEYALEGVVTRGRLQTFAIFDKPDPLDGPFFEETIYLTPARRAADVQLEAIAAVQNAVRAIGLRHGPVHAEFRLTSEGVFVLEIAARPIGGLCSRVLRFGDGGVPLEEVLLRHAAGEDVRGMVRETQAAGVMMIPIPAAGLLKGVEGQDDAAGVDRIESVHITAKPDQLLERLPEAGSYLGFIFARGESPAFVERALREAHGRLRFTVQPPIALSR